MIELLKQLNSRVFKIWAATLYQQIENAGAEVCNCDIVLVAPTVENFEKGLRALSRASCLKTLRAIALMLIASISVLASR